MSLVWALLVGFLLYWLVLATLNRTGRLPSYVKTQGPIITVHTARGREALDRLARPRRFWRAWGNFGIGVTLVVMAGMFLVVVTSALAAMSSPEQTRITEPRNVLVIPGVNEFLPLSAAPEIVFGLVIGLVVHEGGHGLLCRVEDIEIESMGIALLAFIPLGAFVQPDHDSQQAAERGGTTRMFAAGAMNNFVVTVAGFALLFWLVATAITVAPGAPVATSIDGSGAAVAGIAPGDRIVAVDGTDIATPAELDEYLQSSTAPTVTVELADDASVDVERSLIVIGATPNGPADVEVGDTITSVNGDLIATQAAFETAAREHAVLSVESADRTVRFPVGAYVPHVSPDGPAAEAGMATSDEHFVIVTAIDAERTISTADARAFLAETTPGQTVEVTAYVYERDAGLPADATPETFRVTLGEHPTADQGFLGVSLQPGLTGLSLNDFGTRYYPADRFLATIGGDTGTDTLFGVDSFFGKIFSALVLPVASLLGPGIDQNFPGFVGHAKNFYTVDGPMGILGPGAVFLAANLLFWSAWINLNLGIFNCIPAFPLDGGHLLRSSAESVVARLPIENRYIVVKYVTISIGLLMLFGLILMVFGQGLLA